jgi:hypothetical protein
VRRENDTHSFFGNSFAGATRADDALRLLAAAIEDFEPERSSGNLRSGDLPYAQLVSNYHAPEGQLRYVHMYAAKYIGLWSALRRELRWDDWKSRDLVSIGAGPMLGLLGWCLNEPWPGKTYACDPLLSCTPDGTGTRCSLHPRCHARTDRQAARGGRAA